MSKNLFRSIVSSGSVAALAAASLIGLATPANAAAALTISVAQGSGFTFVEDSDPAFVISGNSDFIASNGTQLRVSLKNMNAVSSTLSSFTINGVTLAEDYSSTNSGNSIAYATASNSDASTVATTDGTQSALVDSTAGTTTVFGLGATSGTFGVTYSTSAMTSPFTFSFVTDAAVDNDTTDEFLMTAWADANNNGAVDAGEISVTQTITFIAQEDVTGTATVGTPLAGGDNFTGSLNLNVNEAYVAAGTAGVYVLEAASTNAALNLQTTTTGTTVSTGLLTNVSNGMLALNAAKTSFSFTVNPSSNSTTDGLLSASGQFSVFTLTPIFKLSSIAATDTVGTAVTVRTASVAVSSTESTITVVTGANAKSTGTGTADVRRNSEFRVMADFEDTNGNNLVGKAVTWTVSSNQVLTSSKTVSVAGTAYSDDDDLADVEVAATTDSVGRAFLTLNTAGFPAGATLTINATADGITETLTATAVTPAYTPAMVEGQLATDTGYGKTIAAGGSLPVAIAVADQWGVAPADGVQRVTVTRATNASRTTAANWSYVLPVVGGVASGTIVDNGAGAGSDTITATLSGTDGSGAETFTLTYSTAAAASVTSILLTDNQGTGDSNVRLDTDALPSWHYFLNKAADEPLADANNFVDGATTGTSNALLTISGTALNAAGTGVAGSEVTISAKGLTFEFVDAAGNEIYSRDSIKVPTTAGGAFSVFAYSDGKGGSTVITATVGTVSGSTTVTFDGGTASALTVTAPATAADGRAIDVVAKLTDVAGDPVAGVSVSFKATGVGYLSSLTGTTDAAGEVVVKLITQTGETGTAVVTATATLAGVSTAKSATINVAGKSASAKTTIGSFNGRWAVRVENAQGARISVKAGTKWYVYTATNNNFLYSVKSRVGASVPVSVYVDRVLNKTETITVK